MNIRLMRQFRRSLQIKKSINLLNSQSIPINMVGYKETSDIAKKAAEVAQ